MTTKTDSDEVWDKLAREIDDPATASSDILALVDPEHDTRELPTPSLWEERFESQVHTFFDEAIARVPGFVDRNLQSFRRVLARNLAPKTGVGDMLVGLRNLASGVSRVAGGPDFSTTTFTHDKLTEAFEREVVSPAELESLLGRLFDDFEQSQWEALVAQRGETSQENVPAEVRAAVLKGKLVHLMERDMAHDPALAQAIRAGLKIGIPATLGYVLVGRAPLLSREDLTSKLSSRQLKFYHKILDQLGELELPSWMGMVGWAGGVMGSLALGGVMEYALNSVRDVKGTYIRQLNAARHMLLYGDNPEEPAGQGLIHIVRGLERQFERVHSLEHLIGSGEES